MWKDTRSSEVERMLLDSDYEDADVVSEERLQHEESYFSDEQLDENVVQSVSGEESDCESISAHLGLSNNEGSIIDLDKPSGSGLNNSNIQVEIDGGFDNIDIGPAVGGGGDNCLNDDPEQSNSAQPPKKRKLEKKKKSCPRPKKKQPTNKNQTKNNETTKKKTPKFQDSDWPWLDEDNVPKKIDFQGTPGLNVRVQRSLGENPTELDCFEQFIGEEFWHMLCTETNDYARKQLLDESRKSLKTDKKWLDVSVAEMKAYFALYVLMGQLKKPSIQMYWSKRKIIETPIFSETMSMERFNSISRFLHFYDEATEDLKNDKLKKIRPVIRYLETKFLQTYEPEQKIALDETLLKMRARLGIIQFNPKKRARFGVKIYKVCESSSGYCMVFKIYVGDDKQDNTLASTSVTLDLLQPFFGKGYIAYLDNWYSSPLLYTALLKEDTYAVGTAISNRQCMPRVFLKTNLEKGDFFRRAGRGVLAIKWKDRKDVHILSTLHKGVEMETAKVVTWGTEEEEIKKPKAVIDYNSGMLGVDRQDQVLSCFPIMRRNVKAYKKIFFYLMDMATYNAFCIFKKVTNKKLHYTDFRLNLVDQLLQSITLPQRTTPGRAPIADSPLRLQSKNWGHFPLQIPPTACKQFPTKPCKVCTKHKKRAEVRWMCEKCKVPLHLEQCFKDYHTKVEY